MRMRKKKHLDERLTQCAAILVEQPESMRGAWRSLFGPDFADASLEVEIGCGKGAFLLGMAAKYPDRLFLGIERCPEALLLAAEKIRDAGLPNARLLLADAAKTEAYFAPGEVSALYLNFSDPWPKSRHAKRRLTAPSFLASYRVVLQNEGRICQKTDNALLFESSLENYAACGWRTENVCRDLHASPLSANNVMTEYEKNFSEKGAPILYVEAYKE